MKSTKHLFSLLLALAVISASLTTARADQAPAWLLPHGFGEHRDSNPSNKAPLANKPAEKTDTTNEIRIPSDEQKGNAALAPPEWLLPRQRHRSKTNAMKHSPQHEATGKTETSRKGGKSKSASQKGHESGMDSPFSPPRWILPP